MKLLLLFIASLLMVSGCGPSSPNIEFIGDASTSPKEKHQQQYIRFKDNSGNYLRKIRRKDLKVFLGSGEGITPLVSPSSRLKGLGKVLTVVVDQRGPENETWHLMKKVASELVIFNEHFQKFSIIAVNGDPILENGKAAPIGFRDYRGVKLDGLKPRADSKTDLIVSAVREAERLSSTTTNTGINPAIVVLTRQATSETLDGFVCKIPVVVLDFGKTGSNVYQTLAAESGGEYRMPSTNNAAATAQWALSEASLAASDQFSIIFPVADIGDAPIPYTISLTHQKVGGTVRSTYQPSTLMPLLMVSALAILVGASALVLVLSIRKGKHEPRRIRAIGRVTEEMKTSSLEQGVIRMGNVTGAEPDFNATTFEHGDRLGDGTTSEEDYLGNQAPTPALKVAIRRGDGQGEVIEIHGSSELGREQMPLRQRNRVGLTGDPMISRVHARLTALPDGSAKIEHLSRTNKTYLNNHPIASEATLAHGDVIRLGQTELEVVLSGAIEKGRVTT